MANYTVFRSDAMEGTDVVPKHVSVQFYNSSDETEAIENGSIVRVGLLLDGEREVRKATAPVTGTALEHIAIMGAPELMADERLKNLDDFINEAGVASRAYMLSENDIFSVTTPGLTGKATPAVGDLAEVLTGTTKINIADTATSGAIQIGYIEAIENTSRYTYYTIHVGTVPA